MYEAGRATAFGPHRRRGRPDRRGGAPFFPAAQMAPGPSHGGLSGAAAGRGPGAPGAPAAGADVRYPEHRPGQPRHHRGAAARRGGGRGCVGSPGTASGAPGGLCAAHERRYLRPRRGGGQQRQRHRLYRLRHHHAAPGPLHRGVPGDDGGESGSRSDGAGGGQSALPLLPGG